MNPSKTHQSLTTHEFDELPGTALVRIKDLVRHPNKPHERTPLPMSAATLWRKVANGTFPAPIKLGARIACWRVDVIRTWLDAQTNCDKEAM